jgi:prepilin-type N-terminal cleavage/methylation domain-containing protein
MKYTENTKATQSGMTLIELSVVLLVMVGLAGVAVPYVAGMADKAHDSTTGSSIAQLNQTIAGFRGNHNALPEKLETLVDTSGAMIPLISDTNYASGGVGLFVSHALTAEEALSLRKAGMGNVLQNVAPGSVANGNRTFGSTGEMAVTQAVATGVKVAQVSTTTIWGGMGGYVSAHLAYALGGNSASYDTTCYNYIGMGIGDGNEMVGTAMQSAPVLFVPNGDFNPEKAYARYIAIFKIQKSVATASGCPDQVQPATFLGAVADMDFGALVGSAASQQWATSSKRQAN